MTLAVQNQGLALASKSFQDAFFESGLPRNYLEALNACLQRPEAGPGTGGIYCASEFLNVIQAMKRVLREMANPQTSEEAFQKYRDFAGHLMNTVRGIWESSESHDTKTLASMEQALVQAAALIDNLDELAEQMRNQISAAETAKNQSYRQWIGEMLQDVGGAGLIGYSTYVTSDIARSALLSTSVVEGMSVWSQIGLTTGAGATTTIGAGIGSILSGAGLVVAGPLSLLAGAGTMAVSMMGLSAVDFAGQAAVSASQAIGSSIDPLKMGVIVGGLALMVMAGMRLQKRSQTLDKPVLSGAGKVRMTGKLSALQPREEHDMRKYIKYIQATKTARQADQMQQRRIDPSPGGGALEFSADATRRRSPRRHSPRRHSPRRRSPRRRSPRK